MAKLKVLGKQGVFMLVKRGRLAQDAEMSPDFKSLLQYVDTTDALELDASAVAMLRQQLNGG